MFDDDDDDDNNNNNKQQTNNNNSTAVRIPFDYISTSLPSPFDDLRYDCRPLHCGLLHCVTAAISDVTVALMTFDKQSNGRRIEVESYL